MSGRQCSPRGSEIGQSVAMGTTAADVMRSVASDVAPSMKQAGFRKRRNGFNRSTAPGVVHVMSFQMSPHRGFGPASSPATFTINLGVYIEAVARQLARQFAMSIGGTWINEYDCQCRQRIGDLLPERGDRWWPLSDARLASSVAGEAIRDFGLPWLDELPTVRAVVRRYDNDGAFAVSSMPVSPWIDLARAEIGGAP
jgi:hypothetical protein